MSRVRIKDLLDREVEKPILEQLYLAHGVATDQLRRAPQVLEAIAAAFNRLASRDADPLPPGVLLRYMINRRKQKDWPRLDGAARKFLPICELLADGEIEHLRDMYVQIDVPSDEYLFQPECAERLAVGFHRRTGRAIDGWLLVAVVQWHRKHRRWPKIRQPAQAAFADIDEVA